MADFDPEQDQEIHVEVEMDFSVATIAQMVRAQLLQDARRVGTLYGTTWAQKRTPLASKPQVPGTQRTF